MKNVYPGKAEMEYGMLPGALIRAAMLVTTVPADGARVQ